jgi:uncharacterized protein YcsI (UPF0317 family)
MAVGARGFYNTYDAVRAIQITSRHLLNHGAPIHIGDPAAIGVKSLLEPSPLTPDTQPYLASQEPPKSGEIVLWWGEGTTPQIVAMESKIPFMITHSRSHMFVTDRLAEELAIL